MLQKHHWLLFTTLLLTLLACLEPKDAVDVVIFGLVEVLLNSVAMAPADADE